MMSFNNNKKLLLVKVLVGWLVGAFNKRRSYEGPSLGTVKFQKVLLKTLMMDSGQSP